nr:hypothetical protein [Bacillaceae bacterium]
MLPLFFPAGYGEIYENACKNRSKKFCRSRLPYFCRFLRNGGKKSAGFVFRPVEFSDNYSPFFLVFEMEI